MNRVWALLVIVLISGNLSVRAQELENSGDGEPRYLNYVISSDGQRPLPFGRVFDRIKGIILGAKKMPEIAKKVTWTAREKKIFDKAQSLFAKVNAPTDSYKNTVFGLLDQTADTDGIASEPENCYHNRETLTLHKTALYAADAAYDIGGENRDQFEGVPPAGYKFLRLFGNGDPTGFQAVAFEPLDSKQPRIYAMAGSQVFERLDWRDIWANLGLGISHATSEGAHEMLIDAFQYARHQGDVLVTGQSLGSHIAQHFSYFLQRNLNRAEAATKEASKGKVSMVGWGVEGSKELIMQTLVDSKSNEEYDERIPKQVKATGYYFEWDPFASTGTFIGKTLAFPPSFLLSSYEKLHAAKLGNLGELLEGHFLTSYRRASRKGGLCQVEEIYPAGQNDGKRERSHWFAKFVENLMLKQKRYFSPEERAAHKEAFVARKIDAKCGKSEDYPKRKFKTLEECSAQYRSEAEANWDKNKKSDSYETYLPRHRFNINIDPSYY